MNCNSIKAYELIVSLKHDYFYVNENKNYFCCRLFKLLVSLLIILKDKKYSISMVGYLNTQPFQWALEEIVSQGHDIILENPADCAESLVANKVDMALIPVGALHEIADYKIHTDYCIGCDGEVRTVAIYCNEDLSILDTIYLDDHSRTSQLLTKIVLSDFYGFDCRYEKTDISKLKSLPERSGVLMIGDKVFENEGKYKYKHDLGTEWKKFTGLPFVFAVWVSKSPNHPDARFISEMNKRMRKVFENLDGFLQERPAFINGVLQDRYFKKNISYRFAKAKKMALKLFLQKSAPLVKAENHLFSSR